MRALRILIVEDNAMNLILARDLLEMRGHTVLAAASPEEAHALGANPVPDVVLMDIMLPDTDGVSLMRQLRLRPEWASIPFVAFTAHAMMGDRERLMADGFAGYISKPIETRRFASDVEQFA